MFSRNPSSTTTEQQPQKYERVAHDMYLVHVVRPIPDTECYTIESLTICSMRGADVGALLLQDNANVLDVWPDGVSTIQTTECQPDAEWHLAAVSTNYTSQRVYMYDTPQRSTTAYIVDTWIDTVHPEFEGRATRGFSSASGQHYHGTHVAGLVAGKTYGVNRAAYIVSVQVLDDHGSGTWSQILAGLEYVSKQGHTRSSSVVNMSVGGGKSAAIDAACNEMSRHGWRIAAAAGNSNADACQSSPSGAKSVLTVGAYDIDNRFADFSNWGTCVDILAPGVKILSAYPQERTAYLSGTSMATPIVAGVWSLHTELDSSGIVHKLARHGRINNLQRGTPNTDVYLRPADPARCRPDRLQMQLWQ